MIQLTKLADILSYILSPASIGGYCILIIAFLRIPQIDIMSFIGIIAIAIIFLCIAPIIGILYYTRKGTIDIWVSERETRTPFYIIAIISYIVGVRIFYYLHQHEFLVFTLSYLTVTTVITLINLQTKISSHIAGLTGPSTAIVYLFGMPALSLFLLLPPLLWARLKLNAHSIPQLISGGIISIIVTYVTYFIFY